MVELYSYQKEAIDKLHTGSILCGKVGTGKSIVALAYYVKVCGGYLNTLKPFKHPKDLYIITTARKRDTLEWEQECSKFLLFKDYKDNVFGVSVTVDSWNNILKYVDVTNAFFIFDEQRVVGSGVWAKSFIKIAHRNDWILLSATPGDTRMDYIPVLVANRFYKNRTQFIREHVVFSRFSKYPKVDRYINVGKLDKRIKSLLVNLECKKKTKRHYITVDTSYNAKEFNSTVKNRFNKVTNKPMKSISELCYALRTIVNSDPSRLEAVKEIIRKHKKVIIFYNFDYELEVLRTLRKSMHIEVTEWNGKLHQSLPSGDSWAYLVQYAAGAEGWNCIETDTIIFYSLNYSYRATEQAAGRIDRINTPFIDLYYYSLKSNSMIDNAISKALSNKEQFNEKVLPIAGFAKKT